MVLAQAAVAQKEIAKLQIGSTPADAGKGAQGAKGGAKGGGKEAAPQPVKAAKRKPDQVPFAPADWSIYELPAEIIESFATSPLQTAADLIGSRSRTRYSNYPMYLVIRIGPLSRYLHCSVLHHSRSIEYTTSPFTGAGTCARTCTKRAHCTVLPLFAGSDHENCRSTD